MLALRFIHTFWHLGGMLTSVSRAHPLNYNHVKQFSVVLLRLFWCPPEPRAKHLNTSSLVYYHKNKWVHLPNGRPEIPPFSIPMSERIPLFNLYKALTAIPTGPFWCFHAMRIIVTIDEPTYARAKLPHFNRFIIILNTPAHTEGIVIEYRGGLIFSG